MQKSYQQLIKKLGENRIKTNEPMSLHTTFKIGGPADLFYEARTTEEVVGAVGICRRLKVTYFILGGGSNLLVSDKGIRGMVIKISNIKYSCEARSCSAGQISNTIMTAEAGVQLSDIVEVAAKNSLSGLEFAVGIPGTLGGALRGNAGAWQQAIGDRVLRVRILNRDGKVSWINKRTCQFDYRQSRFKKNGEIILAAELGLEQGSQQQIRRTMTDNLEKRKSQPQEPSAGSIFTNPKPEAAARLIEECNLKGYRVGKACFSKDHANFIVNLGLAKAKDVLKLIGLAQRKVKEKFGIRLETEVKIIGEF